MKNIVTLIVSLLVLEGMIFPIRALEKHDWKANWITKSESQSEANTWIAFRKNVQVDLLPTSLKANIAADTKYWLWINGKLVVFEGGLKRGPSFGDTYYDEVEIAPYLKKGENQFAILLWHFGRNGFAHINSGMAGMLFEAISPEFELISDNTWEASVHHSFKNTDAPFPNYRMAESNIRFDAREDFPNWNKGGYPDRIGGAMVLPMKPGDAPFGKLVKRPIPLWKDSGLKKYESIRLSGDTLICRLPYNCQVTPYMKIKSSEGKLINIQTDQYWVGEQKTPSVRAEYITTDSIQEFECYGWMNGHEVHYFIPKEVEILDVKYRETGYDTDFTGKFHCNDDFFNQYWNKSVRTLYVCMRDNYMDCPDRERGQWWGDEVNELGMAFYMLSPSSQQLAVKGIYELMNWQKADGSISSPVPAGNYSQELPAQMLAAVGWYGFHHQYFYSADSSFIPVIYERLKKYLHETWKLDEDGLPIYRKGGWDWVDAGSNRDKAAIIPCWFYLALKAEKAFATQLGEMEDVIQIESMMKQIYISYNKKFWTGSAYRSFQYEDKTDDRVQAMAVVSGLASIEKYPFIKEIFKTEYHATAYMQKYIIEALFLMKEPSMALDRMRKMGSTLMKENISTLYEDYNYSGSSNHAWSGAPTILYVEGLCGIKPLEPGFKKFQVAPQMGYLKEISQSFDTKFGTIEVSLKKNGKYIRLNLTVPEATIAEVKVSPTKTKLLRAGKYELKILDLTK